MKYIITAILILAGMAGSSQTFTPPPENNVILPAGHLQDSTWHLKGTHKKITRRWVGTVIGDVTGVHISYVYDTTDEAFARQLDTIDVWRMVCDTTPGFGHGVKLMGIKEVREMHNEAEGVIDPGFYFGRTWHDYWKHLKYLTQGGHRLPKGMVVIEREDFSANEEPEYSVTLDPPQPLDRSDSISFGGAIRFTIDTAFMVDSIYTLRGTGGPVKPSWSGGSSGDPILTGTGWMTRHMRKRYERYLKQQKLKQ
jgi:hypothetical protein